MTIARTERERWRLCGKLFLRYIEKPAKSFLLLAGAPGFEPGTYGFGDRRSTN